MDDNKLRTTIRSLVQLLISGVDEEEIIDRLVILAQVFGGQEKDRLLEALSEVQSDGQKAIDERISLVHQLSQHIDEQVKEVTSKVRICEDALLEISGNVEKHLDLIQKGNAEGAVAWAKHVADSAIEKL